MSKLPYGYAPILLSSALGSHQQNMGEGKIGKSARGPSRQVVGARRLYTTRYSTRSTRGQSVQAASGWSDRLPSAKGVEADVLLRISESPGEPDEFRVTRDKHLRIDLSRRKGDGRGPKANEPPIKMAAQVKTVISQAGRSVRIARNRRDNT